MSLTVGSADERNKDNAVDAKEAKGRPSKKELLRADPDNDGTLTKDEYLAIVAKRFAAPIQMGM